MPAVSDQSENDCLKYCRHSNCQVASIRIFRFIRLHYQVTYIFLTIMGFSSPDFHLACEHTFLVAGVISSGQSTWAFY